MGLFELYLVETIAFAIPFVAYILLSKVFRGKFRNPEKVTNITLKVIAILAVFFVLIAYFHISGAMAAEAGAEVGSINPNVGNVYLSGVPYGTNKFANFLAWLGSATIYPFSLIALLGIIYPFKYHKVINRFVALPIMMIQFITLFNLCNAMNGNTAFDFRNVLLATQNGLMLAALLALRFETTSDETESLKAKDYFYALGLMALAFIFCIPSSTFSTLFSTNGILLGNYQTNLRIYDLKFPHRLVLYMCIALVMVIYFYLRESELNCRKAMLIVMSIGALLVFFTDFGSNDIFRYVDGTLKIHVTSLPIHLCHTALFVVPLCLAFNLKRLFYFTYFINVFGALMAMLMPNVGENSNVFLSSVVLFWYNHFAAMMMPLLCVALGVFEKAKFKQMLWSLLFFATYFIGIVFLNAWLSNYVDGYNPDMFGTGTDFLFINGDFIASKILSDKQAADLLNQVAKWQWGNAIFVVRPLYQTIFFGVYVLVAFGMWFVYSLFFRISDSHKDLHNKLVIARKENFTMKERRKLEQLNNDNSQPGEVSLVFEHFSKKYGNSEVFSAEDVNLKVDGGQIFGFLGPNGAGKSTCIKSAIGIQPVTSGHIFVCGYDTTTESVKSKKEIGYVPDHYALYEKLTGREYINYIADLYGVSKADRDERIARYVNLFELNQAFDNRMQTYSHGMKQKMTIIAALVHNPKVWILDEPLTGLDPQSIFQVKQCMLQHAAEGNIVFFSSHIIDVVEKLCTRIAIIRKGHIVYEADMVTIEKEHPEGLESFYLSMIHDNGEI